MNNLNLLKKRLLQPGSSEQDVVNNLCMVMELCGGYAELMELPMTSVEPILKYLKLKREQEDKRFRIK